jgi:hypothetical protein
VRIRLIPASGWTWLKGNITAIIVFLAVAISVVSLPTIALQGYDANRSQNNHHAASVKQQATIIALLQEVKAKDTAIREAQMENKGTLTEISALEKEVSTVIEGLPAADTAIITFATWIEGCLATGNCSNPPQL